MNTIPQLKHWHRPSMGGIVLDRISANSSIEASFGWINIKHQDQI